VAEAAHLVRSRYHVLTADSAVPEADRGPPV